MKRLLTLTVVAALSWVAGAIMGSGVGPLVRRGL
jgi:hypothetical protein